MGQMPPEAMGGMTADMMGQMPPEAGGMNADMMGKCPHAMGGMTADHMQYATRLWLVWTDL